MSLLVVGTDGPVARALHDAAPAATPSTAVEAVRAQQPGEIAIVSLPAPAGPIGALPTAAFEELADATITLALAVARAATQLAGPVRIALICPADGVIPDHLDGARSVVGAALTMLAEVAAALPGITINTIAVADDVPAEEVATVARLALSGTAPSLNGATIRLDGGRDAVLTAETRAEEA